MEADVSEKVESVSLVAVNNTEERVSDKVAEEDRNVGETVRSTATDLSLVVDSHDNTHHHDNGCSGNPEDDYYEVISADGSVGGDDIDTADDKVGVATNFGCPPDSSSLTDRSQGQSCPFVDLPFVPKFEFPLDSSQSENVSNYGASYVNQLIPDNIPKPDKNFTIPPPNYKPLDIKPLFDSVQGPHCNPLVLNPPRVLKDEIISSVSEKPSDSTPLPTSQLEGRESELLPGPSKPKDLVADWVDENGDPLPGAFDYVKPNEDRDKSGPNSRVEYVFSVREKKDVPVDSNESCVLNSGIIIDQNVLNKNVAGNLGVPLGLVAHPSGFVKRLNDEDEEKKLYEASKNGTEYKAAVAASSSVASTPGTKSVSENENVKKDRLPRFRRNRFTDVKKDEKHDDLTEVKPQKSAEEAALENQAVTEILKEVQRGAARAKEIGALGWQKSPIPVTNKTFLRNTLVSTLREPYRPPSKRGRFHVGLKTGDDRGTHHKTRDRDRSSSSSKTTRLTDTQLDKQPSRSSRSRSHSSSYSRSHSRSSYTDDDSHSGPRNKRKYFGHRGGRGSWHRGQHHFYDEAWAAYAAHYGYPWYGPEAVPMFYGPEGWPVDPYAAMYYGEPQVWMEYEPYYGGQNFGPRGMGRGFRGRGRGDRGRGRGGYDGDFQGYGFGVRSPRGYSRSHSRSAASRSWSRDRSRSRSRSRADSHDMRGPSHSTSHDHTQGHRRRLRSKDRSIRGDSGDKIASDVEINEKKKKKKKKKKKHKKLKKSKHRLKDDDSKEKENTGEGIDETGEKMFVSVVSENNEKSVDVRADKDGEVKDSHVIKLGKRKQQSKHTREDNDETDDSRKSKDKQTDSDKPKEETDGGSEGISVMRTRHRQTDENNDVFVEAPASLNEDKQTFDGRDKKKKTTRKQKEKLPHTPVGEVEHKDGSSHHKRQMLKLEDLHHSKLTGDKVDTQHESWSGDSTVRQVSTGEHRTYDDQGHEGGVDVRTDQKYDDCESRRSFRAERDVSTRVADRGPKYGSCGEVDEGSALPAGKNKHDDDRSCLDQDRRSGHLDRGQQENKGNNVDRRGDIQVSETGRRQVDRRGGIQVSETGGRQICRRGGSQVSETGERQVDRRGGSQVSETSGRQVDRRGGIQVSETGGRQICRRGDIQVSATGRRQVDRRGGIQVSETSGRQVDRRGGSQVSETSGRQVDRRGGSQVSETSGRQVDRGGSQVSETGGRQVDRRGGSQVSEKSGRQVDRRGDSQVSEKSGRQVDSRGDSQVSETSGRQVDRRGGSQVSETGGRPVDKKRKHIYIGGREREYVRSDNRDRPSQENVKYGERKRQRLSETMSESGDSEESDDDADRSRQDGRAYTYLRDVMARSTHRSKSPDSTRRGGVADSGYTSRANVAYGDKAQDVDKSEDKRRKVKGGRDLSQGERNRGHERLGEVMQEGHLRKQPGDIRDVESTRSFSCDGEEKIRNINYGNQDRRGENSGVTVEGRKSEKVITKSVRDYVEENNNPEKMKRGREICDNKKKSRRNEDGDREKNKSASKEQRLQIVRKDESCEKKTLGLRKVAECRRRRSASSDSSSEDDDDSVCDIQTKRIINVTAARGQNDKKASLKDNVREEGRKQLERNACEGRNVEELIKGEQRKNQSKAKYNLDKEAPEGSCKRHTERVIGERKKKDEKSDAAVTLKVGQIPRKGTPESTTQYSRLQSLDDRSSSEKQKHLRVIKATSKSRTSSVKPDGKYVEVKNQGGSVDRGGHVNIPATQNQHSLVDRSTSLSRAETEAPDIPNEGAVSTKQKKPSKKQEGIKEIKPRSAGEESARDEGLVMESAIETRDRERDNHCLNETL